MFDDHVVLVLVLTLDESGKPENRSKARGKPRKKHDEVETCKVLVCRYCTDAIMLFMQQQHVNSMGKSERIYKGTRGRNGGLAGSIEKRTTTATGPVHNGFIEYQAKASKRVLKNVR